MPQALPANSDAPSGSADGPLEPVAGRPIAQVVRALSDDAQSRVYLWIWRPMIGVQFILYVLAAIRLVRAPAYAQVGGLADPMLHENHLGNLIVVRSQPNRVLLGLHMAMAVAWMGATLLQKQLVAGMAAALAGDGPGRAAAYARIRRVHATVGWILVPLALAGILVAPVITLMHHGNPPMMMFLVGQPLFFVPILLMVLLTARDRSRSIRHHRFWTEVAFVGPALSAQWSELLIYLLGRKTPLGPRIGEVTASVLGALLGVLFVVVPAWLARKRGLAADAAIAEPAA